MAPHRPSPARSEIVLRGGCLYHLGFAPEEVANDLILVGDPARAHLVAEQFDSVDHETRNREFVTLTGRLAGHPVSVIGTGIGTDNIEIALIETFVARTFDLGRATRLPDPPRLRMIRVGTSGGAREDIEAGTLAIAEYALGLDATGLYYDQPTADPLVGRIETRAEQLLDDAIRPRSRFKGKIKPYAARATPRLFAILADEARARDDLVETGITVSAPGFYGASSRTIAGLRNTVPDIKGTLAELEIEGRRVLNFEMESSLLFHLGEQLGVSCCTICPVISQPGSHASVIDYAPRIERSIGIALAALVGHSIGDENGSSGTA